VVFLFSVPKAAPWAGMERPLWGWGTEGEGEDGRSRMVRGVSLGMGPIFALTGYEDWHLNPVRRSRSFGAGLAWRFVRLFRVRDGHSKSLRKAGGWHCSC
jgi:hypothetical protein